MERLVERSRIRRGPSGKAVKVVGRDGAHEPVAGEKDVSAEVYDDTDFYQALLRDVVDIGQGGAGFGGAGGPGSYANFNNTSRKKAAGVDPKASKGRKLRYHVHEKLQNFMAPIPMQTWEREQIDELFKGLLGGRYTSQIAAEDGEAQAENGGVSDDAGQFRIF
jgi:protein AATF/BFR2